MAALVGCAALRTSPPPPFLFPAALTRERRRPQPQVNPGAPPAHGGGRWAALTAPPGGRREGEANPRATASTTTRRVGEINAAGGRSWWRSARSGRRARGPRRAWRWCGPWLRAPGAAWPDGGNDHDSPTPAHAGRGSGVRQRRAIPRDVPPGVDAGQLDCVASAGDAAADRASPCSSGARGDAGRQCGEPCVDAIRARRAAIGQRRLCDAPLRTRQREDNSHEAIRPPPQGDVPPLRRRWPGGRRTSPLRRAPATTTTTGRLPPHLRGSRPLSTLGLRLGLRLGARGSRSWPPPATAD